MNTVNILIEIASKQFEIDKEKLKPESDLFDVLGINSVQALQLLSEVEKSFDVEIPDYEIQDVRTFLALAEVIDDRL